LQDYSPSLIKKTCVYAEDTLNYAASCVLPIVQTTFEKPIHAVDTLACKTLNKVEETLPVVTKTPEEVSFLVQLHSHCKDNHVFNLIVFNYLQIMTNTRSYVSDKLQPVQTGVSSAVNLVSGATDKLLNNRLARLTLHTAEFTVATVHECIDYIIPPITKENISDECKHYLK
jgi:hypothetical protein